MKILNALKKALIQVMAIISLLFSGHSIPVTLNEALKKYQKGVVEDRCKIIDVDRVVLWKTALVFYKSSPKEHLYRRLNVMFEGMENAVDAGALSLEFFADLMRTINNNLFEGMLTAVFHSIAGKTFTSSKWQVLWLHTHYCRMVLQCRAWHNMSINF